MIVIGNKSELQETRQVDFNMAQMWASREKGKPPLYLNNLKENIKPDRFLP